MSGSQGDGLPAEAKASSDPAQTPSKASRGNWIASIILFSVVAVAPFPFGSTDPATIAGLCIAVGVASAFVSMRALRGSQLAVIALAGIPVVGYGVVLHEQLAATPWLFVATPNPIWQEAATALGGPLEPLVSIARNQPYFSIGAPLLCLLTLVCSFVVCADRKRARQLFQVVACSGVFYAIYGIFAHLSDPTRILWREKQAYFASLTSTFINRNTAAVYFGSCAIIWFVLLSEQLAGLQTKGRPIDWKRLPNRLLSDTPREITMPFFMWFVCIAAMFMTGSRAGVVLSLMALVLCFVVYFRSDLPSWSGRVIAFAICGAVALVLLQYLAGGVSSRFDSEGLTTGGRIETYRATLRMIADHPWFGTGLGTFALSYPSYRSSSASAWGVWDRAHSTPLEIAAEAGIPLALVVVLGWIAIFALLVHGIRVRRRDLLFPVGALCVASVAVLHSSMDFSLQIPGYAVVVFAVVGAGLAQSFGSSPKLRQGRIDK